jgi:hypothetical protein
MVPVTSLADRFVRIPSYPCTYTLLIAESLRYSGISDTTPTFVDMVKLIVEKIKNIRFFKIYLMEIFKIKIMKFRK